MRVLKMSIAPAHKERSLYLKTGLYLLEESLAFRLTQPNSMKNFQYIAFSLTKRNINLYFLLSTSFS